jgi:hypothetical protein
MPWCCGKNKDLAPGSQAENVGRENDMISNGCTCELGAAERNPAFGVATKPTLYAWREQVLSWLQEKEMTRILEAAFNAAPEGDARELIGQALDILSEEICKPS